MGVNDHGKASTYVNYGCRCALCRRAIADYQFNLRRTRSKALAAGAIEIQHGKASTYINYGCRCEACTQANSEYHSEYLRRSRQRRANRPTDKTKEKQ